jgi:hypothetical protein
LRRATAAAAAALDALARAADAVHVPAIGRAPLPMAVDWATLLPAREESGGSAPKTEWPPT